MQVYFLLRRDILSLSGKQYFFMYGDTPARWAAAPVSVVPHPPFLLMKAGKQLPVSFYVEHN